MCPSGDPSSRRPAPIAPPFIDGAGAPAESFSFEKGRRLAELRRKRAAFPLAFCALACVDSRAPALGERLFNGEVPLTGRVAGDPTVLPVEASRCSNCHGRQAGDAAAFGPELTAATLLSQRRRRGGPPSRYDRSAFCVLLRTGVDPAFVLVDGAMPRYDIEDASCEALWNYVTRRS